MKENYYVILGINENAAQDEIKASYRKLIKEYHPDHFGRNSKPFLKIQEAYEVLGNPGKRRAYDVEMVSKKSPQKEDKRPGTVKFRRPPIEPLTNNPGIQCNNDHPFSDPCRGDGISFEKTFESLWDICASDFTRFWKWK